MKHFFAKYKSPLIAVCAVAAVYLMLFALGITCPIKYLVGVSCPGCGMSRACISALRLDFATAFRYHPLFPLLPFFVGFLLFFAHRGQKAAYRTLLLAGVALLVAVYCYRLAAAQSDVVVFRPQEGLVYRIFLHVKAFFTR